MNLAPSSFSQCITSLKLWDPVAGNSFMSSAPSILKNISSSSGNNSFISAVSDPSKFKNKPSSPSISKVKLEYDDANAGTGSGKSSVHSRGIFESVPDLLSDLLAIIFRHHTP